MKKWRSFNRYQGPKETGYSTFIFLWYGGDLLSEGSQLPGIRYKRIKGLSLVVESSTVGGVFSRTEGFCLEKFLVEVVRVYVYLVFTLYL